MVVDCCLSVVSWFHDSRCLSTPTCNKVKCGPGRNNVVVDCWPKRCELVSRLMLSKNPHMQQRGVGWAEMVWWWWGWLGVASRSHGCTAVPNRQQR